MQPEQRVEDVAPMLRARVNEIEAADLDLEQANSQYEVTLGAHSDATNSLQKAEHNKDLRDAETENILRQIEALDRDLFAIGETLRDAPPLEEITEKIETLEAASKRTPNTALIRSAN
jgi:exonuclease VII small subunit